MDLHDPHMHRWAITRKFTALVAFKVVAAAVLFPGAILAGFATLWACAAVVGHPPVVVVASTLLVVLVVALGKLAYDRFWADEIVSDQRPVLGILSAVALFLVVSLGVYLVAAASLIDGRTHSLGEWCLYYGNLLVYYQLDQLFGVQSGIAVVGLESKVVNAVLFSALNSVVVVSVTNYGKRSFVFRDEVVGTPLTLWVYLLSPVFWFENFEIREVGWVRGVRDAVPESSQGQTRRRREVIRLGNQRYLLVQFWRYIRLPWVTIFRRLTSGRRVRTIRVFHDGAVWVIIDPASGLHGIPFVEDMPAMIDFATRHIPSAATGCDLHFSDADFFGACVVLDRGNDDGEWVGYSWRLWGVSRDPTAGNTLCGRLLRQLLPFSEPPARIYVQFVECDTDLPSRVGSDGGQHTAIV